MLPFLKPKKMADTIMAHTEKGEIKKDGVEGEPHPGHVSAAEDMLRAIHSKDAHGLVQAFYNFHDIPRSGPTLENEHLGVE